MQQEREDVHGGVGGVTLASVGGINLVRWAGDKDGRVCAPGSEIKMANGQGRKITEQEI